MFIEDAHILRASSDTVCACISKRPAMDRIACGSVIKRVAMLPLSLYWTHKFAVIVGDGRTSYAGWRNRWTGCLSRRNRLARGHGVGGFDRGVRGRAGRQGVD